MHRFFACLVPLLMLVVSGCSGNDPIDTPTEPAPTLTTETFAGTLTLNGAFSHPFTVTTVTSVAAALTVLTPDSASPVGLALGTWNGSVCQIVLPNDAAIQGSVVLGSLTEVGDFCVRIADTTGTLARPQTYQIDVTH